MNTLVVCRKCEKANRVDLERADGARPVCGSCRSELPFANGVQEVSGSTLSTLLRKADRPVVVDFWAPWCGPCKAFAPVYQAAARELGGSFVLAKLDTEAHPLAAEAYLIRGIPTLAVFRNGMEIDRRSGAMPLPDLLDYLGQWRSP